MEPFVGVFHRPMQPEASEGQAVCPGPHSWGMGGDFCKVMIGWGFVSGGEVCVICNSFNLPLHYEESICDRFQLLGVSAELRRRQGSGACWPWAA